MIVERLKIEGFRNYESSEALFSDNINVIIGGNAQGKTNLLEAVYYLTCGRSFRARSDKELINFNADEAKIEAQIFSGERSQTLIAELSKFRKKRLIVNGSKLKTASELSGRLTAVLFCPDDLTIIRSSSMYRRRLMDSCLSQLRPKYAAALQEYRRLYEQKSRILRDRDPAMAVILDEYSQRMCEVSAILISYRAKFVRILAEKAKEIHREFSGGNEDLDIFYKTVKTIDDPMKKPSELLPFLLEHQFSHRQAEIDSCRCLSGAHKDDLEIFINNAEAKSFASQGQTRTAAISLKMAEREIHFEDRGEYPVLLLDDVLSELDAKRQDFILNRISSGQVLITCCEDQSISEKTGGKLITINSGKVLG